MRYPKEHKAEARARIVKAASVALRKKGLSGISIPALMKQAGLTHGAFYAHFENRDELVANAVRAAAEETAEGVFDEKRTLDEALAHYLSEGHVAHPEQGCVVAALGTDGARQPLPVKKAFGYAARGLLSLVERKVNPGSKAKQVSDDALTHASMIVGAVVLSRLLEDPKLRRRLLDACRTRADLITH